MAAINKDVVLVVSLVLSVVSLVLLFGVTWHFQSSLHLLQQQVEYDRELLFKLQEQINDRGNDYSLNKHDVVKRQSEQNCQCKDGTPGPKGPPGNKGEIGLKGDTGPPGPRGDTGDRGPQGGIGDRGYPGPPGESGQKGDTGLRGSAGEDGMKGAKGDQGPSGTKGVKGDSQSTGLTCSKGAPGQMDTKGDKEEKNGGTVYVRWGHDQCPSTAQLVYSGRAGGPFYSQSGSGSNPQCLPMDPNFLRSINGDQRSRAFIYGAEYETHTDITSHVHGRHHRDVPCAVCHVSNRTAVYMVPAKYTCPTGWTREYYGYLMTERTANGHHRSQYTCMDIALKPVPGSSTNKDGLLFCFVEGRCGSLPCPPYDNTNELTCSVCTK